MLRIGLVPALLLAFSLALGGCYAKHAMRRASNTVESGFDFDDHGPWILITGPGALLIAGGQLAVGSVIPYGKGVDPREPEAKWYHAYRGEMRPAEEVGILCHEDPATWVTGIRPAVGGEWHGARHEKWQFPVCIEALPGRYELRVHYFAREHEGDRDESVSRQAESTEPTYVAWQAVAGQVDVLRVYIGKPEPAAGTPPQRHIPRSRALGTTWWELQESDWYVRIEPTARWQDLEGPIVDERRAWVEWEKKRH